MSRSDRFRIPVPPAVKEPELRALQQILAEAAADGVQVMFLGPAGVLEIAAPEQPGRKWMTAN